MGGLDCPSRRARSDFHPLHGDCGSTVRAGLPESFRLLGLNSRTAAPIRARVHAENRPGTHVLDVRRHRRCRSRPQSKTWVCSVKWGAGRRQCPRGRGRWLDSLPWAPGGRRASGPGSRIRAVAIQTASRTGANRSGLDSNIVRQVRGARHPWTPSVTFFADFPPAPAGE